MKDIIKYSIWTFLSTLLIACGSQKKIPQTITHSSGWSNEVIETCALAWEYSQLSLNVYRTSDSLDISNIYKKLEVYSDSIDFYAELFINRNDSTYVLAFRGTDSKKDFKTGNNPFSQKQNNLGLKVFDSIRNKYGENINIVTTGHSLGGGISIHVSLNRSNLTAFSFNGSSIFRKRDEEFVNKRYSIVEYGEVLKAVRIFGREADQLYTSINCNKSKNPIKQHNMLSLATCITKIAAIKSVEAKESLKRNNIVDTYNSNPEDSRQ